MKFYQHFYIILSHYLPLSLAEIKFSPICYISKYSWKIFYAFCFQPYSRNPRFGQKPYLKRQILPEQGIGLSRISRWSCRGVCHWRASVSAPVTKVEKNPSLFIFLNLQQMSSLRKSKYLLNKSCFRVTFELPFLSPLKLVVN